jgi:hypothetical protein
MASNGDVVMDLEAVVTSFKELSQYLAIVTSL